MKFLNYESKLMSFLTNLTDYLLVGLLWLVCSLPVITFGAATTAMLYTTGKAIRLGEGNVFPTFFQAFRRDFKQATILWLFAIPLLLVVFVNFSLIMQGDVPKALCFVLLPVMAFILGWIQLWFGYLSQFNDTTRVILSNTFRMTIGSLLWVLALLVLLAATVALAMEILMIAAPLLVLVPGIYAMFADKLLQKAFQKYLPQVKSAATDNKELETEN